MSIRSYAARGAIAIAVVAVLAVPAAAWAVPGLGMNRVPRANASRSATATARMEARRQMLADRIATAVSRRQAVFNRVADRVGARIENVAALAAKAGAAGGDVSGVIASLDQARAALATAKTTEAGAMDLFKAVPDATDRKAAFETAKTQAKAARSSLADARSALRDAILKLEAIVTGLQGAAQ